MKKSSFHTVRAVAAREFFSGISSASSWVFLIIFLELSAFLSFVISGIFSGGQADLAPFFGWFPFLFLFLIPALAMPLWAEERRTGGFELTVSFPAAMWELVLGKFLAGWLLVALALFFTLPVPLTALYLGEPDPGAIACGYLGALLLGGTYLSIGCFASALSKSQTASFLFSLIISASFLFAGLPAVTEILLLYLPRSAVSFLSFAAFLPHYQSFQRGLLQTGDIVYTLTLTAFFLTAAMNVLVFAASGTGNIFAPGALRERSTLRAVKKIVLSFLFVFYSFFCLNLMASVWQWKWDMSSDQAYSLSEEASRFAGSLQKQVTMRFYTSRKHPRMPQNLKRYAERVQWLLRDLEKASRGRITLQVLELDANGRNEDAALAEGVEGVPLATGEKIFLGLAVSRGSKCVPVPFLALERENLLEYEVVRAILNVTRNAKPKIGVMSAFEVLGRSPEELARMPRKLDNSKPLVPMPPWYVMQELAESYELVRIPMDVKKIPDGLAALLVIHPAGAKESLMQVLNDYLMKGGRMGIFLDPRSLYATAKIRQDYSFSEKITSDLPRLLKAWGINYNPEIVAADMVYAYRKNQLDKLVTNPAVLLLNGGGLSRKDMSTNSLQLVMLCFAGVLEKRLPPGLTGEDLLYTSENSRKVSAFIADRPELIIRHFVPGEKRLALGVKLSGIFPNAFPETGGKKSSGGNPAVYLFADSDMLFNDVCIRRSRDAYGQTVYLRQNDNTALLQSITEHLASEGDTLSRIRSRLPMSRPLTRYNEIKARAELVYKERIRALERELQEASNRMKSIREQAAMQGRALTLTPLQKREMEQYERNITGARRELQEITRALHSDMAKIDTVLRLINLVAVPGLIALLGLFYGIFRFSLKRRSMK